MTTPSERRPGWTRDARHAAAATVTISVDGRPVDAQLGECLAVALAVAGHTVLRHGPDQRPRGMFCLMGSCQECLLHVDGTPVLACMEPVRAAMRVELDGFERHSAADAPR